MRLTYFFYSLLILLILSCSSNDSNESKEDNVTTLKINNVYLEDPTDYSNGTNCTTGLTFDCWKWLFITDGTFTKSPSDGIYYANDDVSYIISFVDLRLLGNFSTPNIYADYNNEPNTNEVDFEGIIFYDNIVVENNTYVSSRDLTDSYTSVVFELISENNFKFEIEMLDGKIIEGSFNGPTTLINDNHNGFEPDVYWQD